MTEPGLSLVGFMTEAEAVQYLGNSCAIGAAGPAATWQAARDKLGEPFANAGLPDIQDLPDGHDQYLDGVKASPRFADTVGSLGWSFKLVELDPLLAFQFQILKSQSDSLWKPIGDESPTIEQLLPVCLPHSLDNMTVSTAVLPNSVMIEATTANVRLLGAGIFGADPVQRVLAGVVFGVSSPLLQVARFENRCYLRNGYHRAYAARMAGITHLPCIYLEANDYDQVGALGPGFFSRAILESGNPPTVAHFTQGRAYEVMIRRLRRVITLNWSEYAVPESD